MWWGLPMAIQGGATLLSKIFGGDEGGLTDEDKALLQKYWQLYNEGLPTAERQAISAPYYQIARGIERDYARHPGVSGIKSSMIERKAMTPMSRAVQLATNQREMGLLDAISGITGRATPRTGGWGQTIGQLGAIGAQGIQEKLDFDTFMKTLKEILGEGGNQLSQISPMDFLNLMSGYGKVGYGYNYGGMGIGG